MKGTLTKLSGDKSWHIMRLEENEWETYYPLHPENVKRIQDGVSEKWMIDPIGQQVEFQLEGIGEKQYAKLINDTPTWREIFYTIETDLHTELPMRVKNWLENRFEVPNIKNTI